MSLDQLIAALDDWEGGNAEFTPALARELAGTLRAEKALVYDLERGVDGTAVGMVCAYGADPRRMRAEGNAGLRAGTRDYFGYDPDLPEPRQRNRVLSFAEVLRGRCPRVIRAYQQMGLAGMDQLRVLCCDGPALLAWVGVFRPEPFGEKEKAAFERLVPHLRRRLQLARSLESAALHGSALAAALEALPLEAFVVRLSSGELIVEEANAAGRAAYQRCRRTCREELKAALLAEVPPPSVQVARLPGHTGFALVLRRERDTDLPARLAQARSRWELTQRQSDVLGLLAQGLANKTIATRLGCALKTVEIHVSALLQKAEAESRSELIARFCNLDNE